MRLSRFNRKGVAAFQQLLQGLRDGYQVETPLDLVIDRAFAEEVAEPVKFDVDVFSTRFELANFVNNLMVTAELADDMNDVGLWTWLSAAFLDSTCPASAEGIRRPGADYRHIPSNSWRDFYRHLIRGPVRILRLFQDNPDAAAIVLCQEPQSPGDFVEQLASRQERITNPAIIETANRLYFDPETRKPRKGASPNWRKPGTLRRFGDILDQLDLTYDLYSMSAEDLIGLLPNEFSVYITD